MNNEYNAQLTVSTIHIFRCAAENSHKITKCLTMTIDIDTMVLSDNIFASFTMQTDAIRIDGSLFNRLCLFVIHTIYSYISSPTK